MPTIKMYWNCITTTTNVWLQLVTLLVCAVHYILFLALAIQTEDCVK